MLIDFNKLKESVVPGLNGGTKTAKVKVCSDSEQAVMYSTIPIGGCIDHHTHENSDDISYVLSGTGKATCDGEEEILTAGCCHICKKGSAHSIINTGEEELILLTVVVERL